MKKYAVQLFIFLTLISNVLFFHSIIVGFLSFALYLATTGKIWSQIFEQIFSLRPRFIAHILGVAASIIFLGLLSSVFVVWYQVTPLIFVFLLSFFWAGSFFLRRKLKIQNENFKEHEDLFGFFPKNRFLFFLFTALCVLQVLILGLLRTGAVLESPWQQIHPWYIYNFFVLTMVLVLLLCSRISLRLKFFFVFAFSLLLHLYLPITHVNPWGGDVWRMIGIESKLLAGQPQLPVLFGESVQWRDLGVISLPEALLIPHKYTYGHLLGTVTLLSSVLSLSPVVLHAWFMAIFWSLFLPSIAFAFGKHLFQKNEYALAFAFLTAFPFALQAIGSITVAVSFGFLTFLLALLLWLIAFEEENIWQRRIAFTFGIFLCFGYALFALLFWSVVAISYCVSKMRNSEIVFSKFSLKKKFLLGFFTFLLMLIIPAVDFVFAFSHFPQDFSLFASIKRMLANLGGWYFARPITSEEIASGNIIFNHIPLRAYFENIFLQGRFLLIGFMAGVVFFLTVAFWKLFTREKKQSWQILGFLFLLISGAYIIGWYFLVGDRVFVRRLDSVFAFFLVLFSLYGIWSFDFKKYIERWTKKKMYSIFFLSVFLFSFIATILYTSGPDIRVLGSDEYDAGIFLSQKIDQKKTVCVLSDTWILLGLEAATSGNIVGGGFPIDAGFGQKERVALYNQFLKNPDIRIIPEIQKVLGAESCFVALSRKNFDLRTGEKIHAFLGNPFFQSGDVFVYKMDLKK